jgi:hypothetical protein
MNVKRRWIWRCAEQWRANTSVCESDLIFEMNFIQLIKMAKQERRTFLFQKQTPATISLVYVENLWTSDFRRNTLLQSSSSDVVSVFSQLCGILLPPSSHPRRRELSVPLFRSCPKDSQYSFDLTYTIRCCLSLLLVKPSRNARQSSCLSLEGRSDLSTTFRY